MTLRMFGLPNRRRFHGRTVVYYHDGPEWGYRVIGYQYTSSSYGFRSKKSAMKDYAKSRWMFL